MHSVSKPYYGTKPLANWTNKDVMHLTSEMFIFSNQAWKNYHASGSISWQVMEQGGQEVMGSKKLRYNEFKKGLRFVLTYDVPYA